MTDPISSPEAPVANVVLYRPEIPPNTGNIGRSCVAVGAKLWIVGPTGFDLSDSRVRRAGLDYWQHLDLEEIDRWDDVVPQLPRERTFFFTTHAERSLWDLPLQRGDGFVFGPESVGLPRDIVTPDHPNAIGIPIDGKVRSLNLATTVGIVLFEQQRQLLQGSTR